jgi:hypothetical protein
VVGKRRERRRGAGRLDLHLVLNAGMVEEEDGAIGWKGDHLRKDPVPQNGHKELGGDADLARVDHGFGKNALEAQDDKR